MSHAQRQVQEALEAHAQEQSTSIIGAMLEDLAPQPEQFKGAWKRTLDAVEVSLDDLFVEEVEVEEEVAPEFPEGATSSIRYIKIYWCHICGCYGCRVGGDFELRVVKG